MITLYNIPFLSRTDTPYFTSVQDQEIYFQEINGVSVDIDFPPYYKNVIKLDSEYMDILNNCNYIRLTYGPYNYYYFIDSIEILSGGVVRVSITMDTIQTHLYNNCQVGKIYVERELIRRWNSDGTINRDYIRENIGNNNMKVDQYITLYPDENKKANGFIVVRTLSKPTDWGTDHFCSVMYQYIHSEYKEMYDGSYLILIPSPFYKADNRFPIDYIQYIASGESVTYTIDAVINALSEFQDDPNVISINWIPDIGFSGTITWDSTNKTVIYRFGSEDAVNISHPYVYVYYYINNGIRGNYNFNFTQNTQLEADFSYLYCPVVLDSNYIDLYFGERLGGTHFPLETLSQSTIYCYGIVDIFSGVRSFNFSTNTSNYSEDPYLTRVVNDNVEYLLMINDVWKQYISNHYGSLQTSRVLGTLSAGLSFATGNILGGVSSMIDVGKSFVSEYDMKNAPRQATQGNTYTNDFIINSNEIVLIKRSITKDLNDVARYFEYNGYRVDKYYFLTGEHNLDQIFTRRYFNYIKARDIDITYLGMVSEEERQDIEDRFKNGIRFWSVFNFMTAYFPYLKWDNIELG